MAQVRDEQRLHLLRRLDRAARLLQLEPRVRGRQLQLPGAEPALGAPAEGDPRAGERAVGDVVVDRGEDARLERVTASSGSSNPSGASSFRLYSAVTSIGGRW